MGKALMERGGFQTVLPQDLGFPKDRGAAKTGSTVRTWALPQPTVQTEQLCLHQPYLPGGEGREGVGLPM